MAVQGSSEGVSTLVYVGNWWFLARLSAISCPWKNMGTWTTWHAEKEGSFWSGTCIFAALAAVINSSLWPFTSDIFSLAKSKTVLLPPAPCRCGSFRQWNMLQPLKGGQGTCCWESEMEKGSGNRTKAFAFIQPWLHPRACVKPTRLLVVCWEDRSRCSGVL